MHSSFSRARKIQCFMSQPFQVAQVFTGYEGKLVSLKDTIDCFLLAGTIEDVKAKAASPRICPLRRCMWLSYRHRNSKSLQESSNNFELQVTEKLCLLGATTDW